jgi:hypothetical protein
MAAGPFAASENRGATCRAAVLHRFALPVAALVRDRAFSGVRRAKGRRTGTLPSAREMGGL